MIQHLDLFSGIGGFSLAGYMVYREQWNTVAFCEIDKNCHAVLNKNFRNVPIYNDITNLNGGDIIRRFGHIDIITAGFPCQPFSTAGHRKGQRDDRFLWPELCRIISEVKPSYLLLENVSGLFTILEQQSLSELEITEIQLFGEDETYLQTDIIERVQRRVIASIIEEIRAMGYVFPELPDGTPILLCIPACAVNAPHRRDRIWITATLAENSISRRNGGENNGNPRGSARPVQTPRPNCTRGKTPENAIGSRCRFGTLAEPEQHREHWNTCTGNEIGNDIAADSANADCIRQQEPSIKESRTIGQTNDAISHDKRYVTHANGIGQQQPCGIIPEIGGRISNDDKRTSTANRAWDEHWITVATRLCGMDDGLPRKLDGRNRAARLKMLGNAIVPQVAAEVLSAMELEQI